jgi:DNA-binding XRE family transcriptional regulator
MFSKRQPNNLSQYRSRMRLSQRQAAVLLGHKTAATLSQLEAGRYLPSLKTALRLSAIYRIPVEFLFALLYTELRNEVRALENPTGQGTLPLTATTHVSA